MSFIYSDDLIGVLDQGKATTKRASHVEPCDGGWKADLTPVGGSVMGPFKKRKDALEAEGVWLTENNIPVPV
jgi:hypothetical protein